MNTNTDFIKALCKKLFTDQFQLIKIPQNIVELSTEASMVLLAKSESPVLYVVAIADIEQLPLQTLLKITNYYLNSISPKTLNACCCNHIICLYLPVTANKDTPELASYLSSEAIFETEKILGAYWLADTTVEKLFFSKNSPSKILNVHKHIIAVMQDKKPVEESLSQIEKERKNATVLPVKATLLSGTFGLIILNILLFVLVQATGKQIFARQAFGLVPFSELNGQFYRLITSAFLHADFLHIAFNALSLFIFGSRTEKYYGTKPFFLLYFLSGFGGDILSMFFTAGNSIGASGAIYGLIGAVLALSIEKKRPIDGLSMFTLLLFIIIGLGMGFLTPRTDNWAHIGGLLSGFFLARFLLKKEQKKNETNF